MRRPVGEVGPVRRDRDLAAGGHVGEIVPNPLHLGGEERRPPLTWTERRWGSTSRNSSKNRSSKASGKGGRPSRPLRIAEERSPFAHDALQVSSGERGQGGLATPDPTEGPRTGRSLSQRLTLAFGRRGEAAVASEIEVPPLFKSAADFSRLLRLGRSQEALSPRPDHRSDGTGIGAAREDEAIGRTVQASVWSVTGPTN